PILRAARTGTAHPAFADVAPSPGSGAGTPLAAAAGTPGVRHSARQRPGAQRMNHGNRTPRPGRIRRATKAPPGQPRLLLLNKPFGVLTQFCDDPGRATIKDFVDVTGDHPAVRLTLDVLGHPLLT